MALREEFFVVLHSGSWTTKAGINVADTNKPPSVTLRTLVGSRTVVPEVAASTVGTPQVSSSVGGRMDETPDNQSTTESIATSTLEPKEEGADTPKPTEEGTPAEVSSTTAPSSSSAAETPAAAVAPASAQPQTIHYCGQTLSEAQQLYPSSELTVTAPIQDGVVRDWTTMEALWRHVLFQKLGVRRSRNASPVLMVVPTNWTKEEHEKITQIFFEVFNVPGLYLAEEPLMALYGCAAVTGLVIDIGHNATEITPILETQIQRHAIQTVPLAGADIDQYFLQCLKGDAQLVREYGQPLDLEFARHLKESGICEILGADEKESKARVQAEYNGIKFTVGNARYKAAEALFNPDLVGKRVLNLIEAIHAAQYACKAEKRLSLWESIIVTGGSCQIQGLQNRIQQEIENSLTVSENFGEFQVREVKFLKVPDYFPDLKNSIQHAGFLGSEIVAKLIFPDPRNYINKIDYNESGPSVVHMKSF